MKTINLIAAILLSSTLAFAADKKADKKSASKTKDMLVVKDAAGQIKWTGFGIDKSHSGTVKVKSATVEMKNENIVGGTFVFDMATLTSPDSEKLVGHLKSNDFFDIEKFNSATLKITQVTALKTGPNAYEITGDLTIKGKTNPITFLATIEKVGSGYKATGTAEIADRTKFDIVYNSKQFATLSKLGDKLIQDNIKIDIEVMTK